MSRDLHLDEGSGIRTTARSFLAVMWTLLGLALGLGVSYGTIRADVSHLRESQATQGEQIATMAHDLKLLAGKVDQLIGYQNGIATTRGRTMLPVDDVPAKP